VRSVVLIYINVPFPFFCLGHNLKLDLFTVKVFHKEAEYRWFNVFETIGLGLTFNKLAVECSFQDWRDMTSEF